MTEDEAKTKWCPMIQVTASQYFNDVVFGDNRGSGDEDHNCIASECMWWVWDADWTDIAADIQEGGENYKQRPCGHCGAINK